MASRTSTAASRFARNVALLGGFSLGVSLLSFGCDSPTQFDDLCGFLADPENCYREFIIDIGTRCGSTPTTRVGEFVSRDKLDLCVFAEGGQAIFEPPIDLANPPPLNIEPIKVRLINEDATQCGVVEFGAENDFSVTIVGDDEETSDPAEFVEGGTFSIKTVDGSDTLALTCPGAGKYNFNRLQLANCGEYEAVMPKAQLDFAAGGTEQAGVVRLWIEYPPIEGELANAQPVKMNYYECIIPGAPPLCENGIQDGSETDVDCGGSFCTTRCADGQVCISDGDCLSDVCGLEMGLKTCFGGG